MMNNDYLNTVRILMQILNIVNQYKMFALKGGTAINLFYDELPRLSLDIDLVYLPLNDRKIALSDINKQLLSIKEKIEKSLHYKTLFIDDKYKLITKNNYYDIKIEPNIIIRGTVLSVNKLELNEKAQNVLELNTMIQCLNYYELFAGKIIAALDRQHPRDLFDIHRMFSKNIEFNEQFQKLIIIYLLQSNRPTNELFNPNPINIELLYKTQFVGLANIQVSLDELLLARKKLINKIQTVVLKQHYDFIEKFISTRGKCDLDGMHISKYPGIKWKIKNLQNANDTKINKEINNLRQIFQKI